MSIEETQVPSNNSGSGISHSFDASLGSMYRVCMGCRESSPVDLDFIGHAVVEAERGATSKQVGIWDIYAGNYGHMIFKAMSHAAHYSQKSIYSTSMMATVYYTGDPLHNVNSDATNKSPSTAIELVPVACAFGYSYPQKTLESTMEALGEAMISLGVSADDDEASKTDTAWCSTEAAKRLHFLDACFPSDVEYEGRWIIEGVFTSPEHRGKGLAGAAVLAIAEQGRLTGHQECLISCAVGNERAKRLYEKIGFKVIGEGFSQEYIDLTGSSGFYILKLDL